jgi:hypothetical protein
MIQVLHINYDNQIKLRLLKKKKTVKIMKI